MPNSIRRPAARQAAWCYGLPLCFGNGALVSCFALGGAVGIFTGRPNWNWLFSRSFFVTPSMCPSMGNNDFCVDVRIVSAISGCSQKIRQNAFYTVLALSISALPAAPLPRARYSPSGR